MIDKTLIKKLALSFARAFAASLLVTVTGLLASPEFKLERAVIISALIAALAAGLRAVQAFTTDAESPGDEVHRL